jgi:NodT family efflux transporter outer membrane factor (OMF) lipoprotein
MMKTRDFATIHNSARRIFMLGVGSTLLAGCGILYRAPTPELPSVAPRFPHATAAAVREQNSPLTATQLDHWWHTFSDPNLDALIDTVLARNNTLAVAALHLKAARLQVHLAVINPIVSATAEAANAKPLHGNAPWTPSQALAVTVSYDLDLSGTLAATRDAASWEALATQQDRNSVAITLVASTVGDYFLIAALNELLDLNDQDIAGARRLLALTQVLKGAGGATALDIAGAEQNFNAQLAVNAALVQQRVEARHALAALLDDEDWPESLERKTLPVQPLPAVEAGLPATLLARRPDLRAAELRLSESLATVEATRRSFYPDLSLTGGAGTSSVSLRQLLADPVGTLTATLTLPFLQIDRAHFATEAARVDYEAAARTFRQTLRQALIDVDNALSAGNQYQLEIDALEQSLQAATTSEHLGETLFSAGAIPKQSWIADQALRRASAEALLNARLLALQNYSTLCLALGGGSAD